MKYTITLDYQGKHYSFQDDYDYQGWDEYNTADYQVTYLYTEGNYNCDCNRSDFLYQYCDVDFEHDPQAEWDESYKDGAWTLPCGDTITLISLCDEGGRVVWPEPVETDTLLFVRQANGLYVPVTNSECTPLLAYRKDT